VLLFVGESSAAAGYGPRGRGSWDADELVTLPCGTIRSGHRAAALQVRTADAASGDADQRVGGLLEDGVRNLVDTDLPAPYPSVARMLKLLEHRG
jgi:hypothetical protein